MNNIIIDAHLHIYPFYNIKKLLFALNNNFNKSLLKANINISSKNNIKIALLAERFDCFFFKELLENINHLNTFKINIEKTNENVSLKFQFEESIIFFIAGRQIITKEGIEILSYGTLNEVKDGKCFYDTINEIINFNAIPAIPFAPGKWLFKKSKILQSLLNNKISDKCIFVDSALRPFFWGIPKILKTAKKQNLCILHGSDPLPFKGDEINAGSLSSYTTSNFDESIPFKSLKNILFNKNISINGIKSELSFLKPVIRIFKNYLFR